MSDIARAYGCKGLLEEETLNVWYKYLNEFAIDVLERVVDDWIKSNERRPSIADLRGQCVWLPEQEPDKYKSAWREK
jgi:hypothetical protein